ncbi:tRNA (adenosine(37)-N6)-threonylcarbamoyltransferase complex ATPase subunit type 1 TsaE [Sulfitobacter sp. F26169L]|uniref:tRNA (adenosine(37)-N6)-threonylcarbamoyltransferase complex ATPase subunit type 1 TsaE n=1 Tax=Sulfitobacter sp. F26169L TaxID=2996015 RepID=UPI0022608E29|nr:tRNA (adenosine(37)-N6)-threonylcarbamoyltransferase complex ATPase subunit type 1 TsaE [Sulfitobacter sp. F26169L]MCX7565871.1 tRNA (adenosine(37)-N6)-threonylcarbamoyltransferase complex ATPase subunit type 1 TsaE [Sulfitobacter sp. F26169L]
MQITTTLTAPDQTAILAQRLGQHLQAGDTILLTGDVGAGKTHFARALIQSLLAAAEDVPSPTFTLVQVYDAASGTEIWHADLYRLSDHSETDELGLVDAMDQAICLIEWPDRLGALCPEDALDITLATTDAENARTLTAKWSASRWDAKLTDWIP